MEGKKKYIAIVLFLLIGLTLFAFANPVEEKPAKKENGNETPEVSKDKEEIQNNILEVMEEEKVLTHVVQKPTTLVQMNQVENAEKAYDAALEAVERAETTFDENDVNDARKLVEKLTDKQEKDELIERIEIIEEALEAIDLIEQLEEMLTNSENKDDIQATIDYRDDTVMEKVETLRNEEVKEGIEDILANINRILDDTTPPTYVGINDNETTKANVLLTVEDETNVEVKVTLNGTEIEYTEGEEFTEEGIYNVQLIDEVFNENSLTFTIDKFTKEDLQSSTEVITIASGEEVVLDLENETVNANFVTNARHIKNEGTLVIKNGNITNNNTGYTYGMIDNYGTLTLENVNIIDNGNGYGSTIRNRAGATMTVKNVSVKDTGTSTDGNIPFLIDGGTVTIENSQFETSASKRYPFIINGGTVTINGSETSVKGIHGGLGVNAGNVEINGGTFDGIDHYGIWITNDNDQTTVTINDGTFIGGLHGLLAAVDDGNQDVGNVGITINGGNFTARGTGKAAVFVNKDGSIREWTASIHAGTFSTDVSSYVAATSTQTETAGKFVVTRN